jgi:hypothetical protein
MFVIFFFTPDYRGWRRLFRWRGLAASRVRKNIII